MRACINSQTPFVRFKLNYQELIQKYGSLPDPVDLAALEEGTDYTYSPGGVTAMVFPLVKRMIAEKYLSEVSWVSLGINYPPRVRVGDIVVEHIEVPEETLREYTAFKENLWSQIHGLPGEDVTDIRFRGYARYNWANSEALLQHWNKTDVFYVQDFQLLPTGSVIGPPAPAVLRWHVPFAPDNLPTLTHRAILKWMEGFDAVVVSTRRDLEGLIKSAYRGRAHQVYPFIDPDEWRERPSSQAVQSISDKIGLGHDEGLLLMVARMDRMKSQDIAIKALAHIKGKGNFKLVLIGNGSFSSTNKGGLGHGKGERWKAELESLVSELNLGDSVVLFGHASNEELRAAYGLASVVLLTSKIEGFGISVLEGWMNKKPVVVSKGAGVAELVVDGSNGVTFEPGDFRTAGEMILKAARAGDKMGENGFETAKQCYIGAAVQKEKEILEEAVSIYK